MSYIQEVIAIVPDGSPLAPSVITPQQQAQINQIQQELAMQPEYFLRWGLATGALYAEEVRVNN